MSIDWQGTVIRGNTEAYMNAVDLNRIEDNIKHLAEKLNTYSYPVRIQTHLRWKDSSIPTTDDIKRICDNITAIINAYYKPQGFNDIDGIPNNPLNNQAVDNLENDLKLIKELLTCMEAGFRKPGFKSGRNYFLPISIKGRV